MNPSFSGLSPLAIGASPNGSPTQRPQTVFARSPSDGGSGGGFRSKRKGGPLSPLHLPGSGSPMLTQGGGNSLAIGGNSFKKAGGAQGGSALHDFVTNVAATTEGSHMSPSGSPNGGGSSSASKRSPLNNRISPTMLGGKSRSPTMSPLGSPTSGLVRPSTSASTIGTNNALIAGHASAMFGASDSVATNLLGGVEGSMSRGLLSSESANNRGGQNNRSRSRDPSSSPGRR